MLTVRWRFRIVTERFMVVAKLSNKGWQLAEMRGTEFTGSNPVYPMWWKSTQYLCGDIDSNRL